MIEAEYTLPSASRIGSIYVWGLIHRLASDHERQPSSKTFAVRSLGTPRKSPLAVVAWFPEEFR